MGIESRTKCLDCSITTIHDNGVIQFPDSKFCDVDEEFESCEPCDCEECQSDHQLNIDLGGLSIDDIIAKDDPPKDLYIKDEEVQSTHVDDDEIDAFEEAEDWRAQMEPDSDDEFNHYDHFGIPSDISDVEAEGLLEAAMSGYER